MKGIILAGGSGTRLYPVTKAISKQLLPIHDKPMIYYPLSVLMMARIREFMIISTPRDMALFKILLGDGSKLGIKIEYAVQEKPDGIASAFKIAKDFIGNDSVALILGDNIFYGYDFSKLLKDKVKSFQKGGTIFGYKVSDPARFGVVEIDSKLNPLSIVEKPSNPKSDLAVVGLYFYSNDVVDVVEDLEPSPRGELEITDLNNRYLQKGQLNLEIFPDGFTWLDTGTPDSLLDACQFVSTIENRQGVKIGCIEEVAFNNQWISKKDLKKIASEMSGNTYGLYLEKICKRK